MAPVAHRQDVKAAVAMTPSTSPQAAGAVPTSGSGTSVSGTSGSGTSGTAQLRQLTDVADILRELGNVEEEEVRVEEHIERLLGEGPHIVREALGEIESVGPLLAQLSATARAVAATVHGTASLADAISKKVKRLDVQQSKVKLALQQVDDAQQLKNCITGLQQAMAVADHDTAATHVANYLALDDHGLRTLLQDAVISLDLIEDADDTNGTSPSAMHTVADAGRMMDRARAELLALCDAAFEGVFSTSGKDGGASDNKATGNDSDAAWLRYWRLYPRLDEPERGLEKICVYLSQRVVRKEFNAAVAEGASFVAPLTQLFELLARIIDTHEGMVRDYYGPGRMLYVVRFLQSEADFHSIRILDECAERRQLARKLKDIQILSSRMHSAPANEDPIKVDLRDLGALLDELAIISQRVNLFQRFLSFRGTAYVAELENVAVKDALVQRLLSKESAYKYVPETGLFRSSELVVRIQDLMSSYYVNFESYYMSQSVKKALRIDAFDTASEELTSSCVDDTFFILKKSILRSFQSQDVGIICVLLNLVTRVVEVEYMRDGIYRRLVSGYGGEKAPMLAERADAKIGYMILLNNLDVSMDYIAKLVTETEHESTRLPVDSQRDREKIHSCLSQLQDTAIVFRTTLATALRALHVQCLRPRIKQLCSELFTNLRYILADDEYTESELLGGMPVVSTTVLANLVSEGAMGTSITREGFVKKVTGTMDRALAEGRYREFLTDNNFAALLQLCVEHLVREWEAAIMASASSRFNALGALRFDKDLRSVSGYLNALLPFGTTRDRFTKLTQIALIVNMESAAEIAEYYGTGGAATASTALSPSSAIQWRLSVAEIRKVLALRFGVAEASAVKF